MMIFSADLYAKVFYSFANHRKRMQWSKFVGWALPFFVVLITVAVTRKQYADFKNCWLNTNNGTVWAFIGPATLVVLINIALITRVLIEVSKKSRSANVTEKRKLDDLKYVAVRASLLLPVIGVTWVFGFMVLFDGDQVVFMYIFVITNTFQGALIWLTQFFWSREVKNAWTSMKKKRHYSLKKVNSRKEKDNNKEFNDIDECAIFPPNSTIDNTYSMTSKKSLTVSSDLTFTTFGTKN
ncbi:adhesion G-protein coupled receptor D1-like [Anneissia japonica]|uniref:adhesion G-protein coupled receptor D1-like n=1 Tax=Anneissia japonica TaxID=1529436 RepID=UPI0014259B0A|nr:adhesion G-protein coupled receptor D1-like [Anneissia japonica]